MGCCCSTNTATTPTDQQSDLKSIPPQQTTKNDQQHVMKKEIFVIKHRISHDETNQDPTFNTTSNKEEEIDDDILVIQCGSRLSRSNSTGPQNPNRKRRSSRSNTSFDLNTRFKNLYHHDPDQEEVRVSSPSSRRNSSRSSSKERRISISPCRTRRRRSESPFRNLNASAGSSNGAPPMKMVSVPATNKSNNAGFEEEVVFGAVKRIHVKRNVSPAKTHSCLQVFAENQSNTNTREVDQMYYRRKSLVEIDNNAARSTQLGSSTKRTRKLSRDMNPETEFDPSPGPPSYASLLLEDIHKFHQKNPNAAASTAPPAFALPECVTKACSIMEAVADLNSNTSSLCSEDRWRNPTMIEQQIKKDKPIESGTVVNGVSAAIEEQESSQAEPTSQEFKVRGLGGFQRDFMDYQRKGTGHGRRSAHSIPKSTTVALT